MLARWAHELVRFDEGYKGAYFEDNDFHVRLHRAGIRAVGLNAEFRHYRSSTLRHADVEERWRINRNFDHNKQRFLEIHKCLPGTKAYAALFIS